jgi:ankyrin repeat protein
MSDIHSIFYSIHDERWEEVEKIIYKQPTVINEVNYREQSVLMYLIKKEIWDLVAKILKIPEVNIHHKDDGNYTALHVACQKGHLLTVQTLVEKGANINETNIHQTNAILYSAYSNHTEVVKYLINIGVNVNYEDSYGNSLYRFIEEGNCQLEPDYVLHHAKDLSDEMRRKFLSLRLENVFK